ncbi:MAG: permease-like cell division protein FtsX [Gammaproteobacteria bacterium]
MSAGIWLARHAQNMLGALGALSRNPVGTLLTVSVIGIALALPAALNVLVQTGKSAAGNWSDVRDFSVYMQPATPLARAEMLAQELRKREGIDSVQLITADAAVVELGKDPVFANALAALEGNPLPHTLMVRPAAKMDSGELGKLSAELQQTPDVDLVKLDLQWVQRLNAGLDFLARLGWIAAVLLGGAVLIIVGNTIRLDIQTRTEEIEVAKLLGATDNFVRRPFLYLGLWYGLFGSVVAILILACSLWLLGSPVRRLAELYGSQLELAGVGLETLGAVLGGGLLAGWGGAWLAVTRHLSGLRPKG